jgi:hypothetical protein
MKIGSRCPSTHGNVDEQQLKKGNREDIYNAVKNTKKREEEKKKKSQKVRLAEDSRSEDKKISLRFPQTENFLLFAEGVNQSCPKDTNSINN